jgi:hypothetical protein
MNQEIKQRWVDALRSGEFEQGHGRLRRPAGYCCLGVLCELYRRDTGDGDWRDDAENDQSIFVLASSGDTMMSHTAFPPNAVMRWAGLEPNHAGFNNPVVVGGHALSHYNDHGSTFYDIAAMIEESL